jgi:hypothetical protein
VTAGPDAVENRPLPLLLSVVVLVTEGVGALAWGMLLIGLAIGFGDVDPITSMVIGAAAVFGVAAIAGGVGAWGRRSWGWLLGVVLQVLVLLGVVVAAVSGGWHPALLVAVALGGAGLAGLLAPASRRTLGA